jgi:pimeloyl-ACP methyl ester carboxylesterase
MQRLILLFALLFSQADILAQSDTIVLREVTLDNTSSAGMTELIIPSGNSLMAGFIYRAAGVQKHPTLLILHGFPGNERNLDLAQYVRSKGWNVLYFYYRGSWGSQGVFSFKNCVEDVINVVEFCKKYQDSLRIDTSNMVLLGHSMGAWVCMKALEQIPVVKKGVALSTWNIGTYYNSISPKSGRNLFMLNTTLEALYNDVDQNKAYYNLMNDNFQSVKGKHVVMIDEHKFNSQLAETIRKANPVYFDYAVWQTDHSFTNKRVALMHKLLEFLNR